MNIRNGWRVSKNVPEGWSRSPIRLRWDPKKLVSSGSINSRPALVAKQKQNTNIIGIILSMDNEFYKNIWIIQIYETLQGCSRHFKLPSSVPVQLRTEISLIIIVTPTHPPHPPGQVYVSNLGSWKLVWKLNSTRSTSQLASYQPQATPSCN